MLDGAPHMATEVALRLGMSLACGFILGFERERSNKPAGLRTLMLITAGSTLFMLVSLLLPLLETWPEGTTRADPGRIAAQIVTGIGFLGAGSIIQSRGDVHGLTTAATIWVASAIGMLIGIGYMLWAGAVTLAVLGMLVLLDPVGAWIARRGRKRTLTLIAPDDDLVLSQLEAIFRQHDVPSSRIHMQPCEGGGVRVEAELTRRTPNALITLLGSVSRVENVRGAPRFGEQG